MKLGRFKNEIFYIKSEKNTGKGQKPEKSRKVKDFISFFSPPD